MNGALVPFTSYMESEEAYSGGRSWNVFSLKDDSHLSLMSLESGCLKVTVVSLLEVCWPGRDEFSTSGYTYYWSEYFDD